MRERAEVVCSSAAGGSRGQVEPGMEDLSSLREVSTSRRSTGLVVQPSEAEAYKSAVRSWEAAELPVQPVLPEGKSSAAQEDMKEVGLYRYSLRSPCGRQKPPTSLPSDRVAPDYMAVAP